MKPPESTHAQWPARLRWWAWVALLLTLPVTSFPYFPVWAGLGETIVRPLALYPLALLLVLDLVPYLLRGGRLPRITAPLLWFALVATVATAVALLGPTPDLRGQTPPDRAFRAVVTLAIGLSFYLTTLRMTADWDAARRSIRWMWIGVGIAVAWGLVQGSRLLFRWPSYIPINAVQRLLSVRDLHLTRVSGFAYEPSWFADQLAGLALPFLIASVITGFHLFTPRRGGRILEVLFLAASLLVLVLTYSRGGLFAFVLSAAVAWLALLGFSRARAPGGDRHAPQPRKAGRANLMVRIGGRILLVAGVLAAAGTLLSRSGYFSLLWTRLGQAGDLRAYLASVGGGSRLALAEAAWEVFEERPFTGVGLGESGFYLLDHLPEWAADRDVEIRSLVVDTSIAFPNPKNLWMRLLAETGLIGVLLFGSFLVAFLLGCLCLLSQGSPRARFIGVAGIMSWVAILLEGVSLDSLALPTMWVALGITSGSIWNLLEARKPGQGTSGENA